MSVHFEPHFVRPYGQTAPGTPGGLGTVDHGRAFRCLTGMRVQARPCVQPARSDCFSGFHLGQSASSRPRPAFRRWLLGRPI